MNPFVACIYWLFRLVIELLIFVFCIAFFFLSFIAVWRIPLNIIALCQSRDYNDFRVRCCVLFGLSLLDVFTLIPLAVCLCCFWRWPHYFHLIRVRGSDNAGRSLLYDFRYRTCLWENMVEALLDIPAIVMSVFLIVTILRSWQTVNRLLEKQRSNWRIEVLLQFLIFFMDLLVLPAVIVIGLTCYRIRKAFFPSSKLKFVEFRFHILCQAVLVLFDLPFIMVGLPCYAVNPWRWKVSYRMFYSVTSEMSRRFCGVAMLGLLLYDLLMLVVFLLLLLLPYRFILCVLAIFEAVRPPVDPTNKLLLNAAHVELPAAGIILRLHGSKDQSFSFKTANLFIRGDGFYSALAGTMGRTVSMGLKAILPVRLVPKYWDASTIRAGDAAFSTSLAIEVGNPKLSREKVLKKLERLRLASDPMVHLHVEYDGRSGTLFDLRFRISELLDSITSSRNLVTDVKAAPVLPATIARPRPLCQLFGPLVLKQLGLLCLDVVVIICFLLSCLFPWRFFTLVRRLLYTDAYINVMDLANLIKDVRKVQKCFAQFVPAFTDFADWSLKSAAGVPSPSREAYQQLITGSSLASVPKLSGKLEPRHLSLYVLAIRLLSGIHHAAGKCASSASLFKEYQKTCEDWLMFVQGKCLFFLSLLDESLVGRLDAASVGLTMVRQLPLCCETDHNSFVRRFDSHKAELIALMRKTPTGAPFGLFERPSMQSRLLVFSTIVEIIKDAAAALGCLVIVAFLYRIPSLVRRMKRDPYDVRSIIFNEVRELLRDVLLLIECLLVVLTIYQAIDLFLALSDALVLQRSLSEARAVGHQYAKIVLNDFFKLIMFLFSPQTFLLAIATAVWGVFAPGEAVFQAVHQGTESKGKAFSAAFLYSLFLYAAPCLIVLVFIENSPSSDVIFGLLGAFFATLLLPIVCSVFLMSDDQRKVSSVHNRARTNMQNAYAWVSLVVEFVQIISLVLFAYASVNPSSLSSSVVDNSLFRVLLLQFPSVSFFDVIFWVVFALVMFFFMLAAAPVVLEDMLHLRSVGAISLNGGWVFWITVFCSTLFEPIIVNLVSTVSCEMSSGEWRLVEEPTITCWSSRSHQSRAVLALVCLAFFVPLSLFYQFKLEDTSVDLDLDVRFSSCYTTIINGGKLLLGIMFPLMAHVSPAAFLWVYTVIVTLLACATFLVSSSVYEVCSVPTARSFRGWSFTACAITGAIAIGCFTPDAGDDWMWILVISSWILVLFLFLYDKHRFSVMQDRKEQAAGSITCDAVGKELANIVQQLPEHAFYADISGATRKRLVQNLKTSTNSVDGLRAIAMYVGTSLRLGVEASSLNYARGSCPQFMVHELFACSPKAQDAVQDQVQLLTNVRATIQRMGFDVAPLVEMKSVITEAETGGLDDPQTPFVHLREAETLAGGNGLLFHLPDVSNEFRLSRSEFVQPAAPTGTVAICWSQPADCMYCLTRDFTVWRLDKHEFNWRKFSRGCELAPFKIVRAQLFADADAAVIVVLISFDGRYDLCAMRCLNGCSLETVCLLSMEINVSEVVVNDFSCSWSTSNDVDRCKDNVPTATTAVAHLRSWLADLGCYQDSTGASSAGSRIDEVALDFVLVTTGRLVYRTEDPSLHVRQWSLLSSLPKLMKTNSPSVAHDRRSQRIIVVDDHVNTAHGPTFYTSCDNGLNWKSHSLPRAPSDWRISSLICFPDTLSSIGQCYVYSEGILDLTTFETIPLYRDEAKELARPVLSSSSIRSRARQGDARSAKQIEREQRSRLTAIRQIVEQSVSRRPAVSSKPTLFGMGARKEPLRVSHLETYRTCVSSAWLAITDNSRPCAFDGSRLYKGDADSPMLVGNVTTFVSGGQRFDRKRPVYHFSDSDASIRFYVPTVQTCRSAKVHVPVQSTCRLLATVIIVGDSSRAIHQQVTIPATGPLSASSTPDTAAVAWQLFDVLTVARSGGGVYSIPLDAVPSDEGYKQELCIDVTRYITRPNTLILIQFRAIPDAEEIGYVLQCPCLSVDCATESPAGIYA